MQIAQETLPRKTMLLHVRPSALEREGACNVIKTINQNEPCRKFVPINQAILIGKFTFTFISNFHPTSSLMRSHLGQGGILPLWSIEKNIYK